jgi:hypothetical protein
MKLNKNAKESPGKLHEMPCTTGEAQPDRSPSKPGMGTITAATDIDPKGRMRWKDAVLSWRLLLGDGKTELQEVSPENLVLAKSESASGRVTLLWQREDGLSIFVEWKEVGDEWEGKISYSGVPEGIYVEQVIFPEAQIPFQESGRILLPRFQGWIVSSEFLRQYGLRRFFGTMQFCAVLQGEKSYYFACHDPKHCSKEYEYNISGAGDDSVLTLKYIHHLPLSKEFAPSGKLPYSVAFRTFSGDWYEAARIYRKWAIQQKWYLYGKAKKNPLRELSLWVWNRTDVNIVTPPVEKIQEDLGLPVAVHLTYWPDKSNTHDYPLYWPPRGGVDAFEKTMRRLKDKGIHTMVYLNGVNWDLGGAFAEEGKASGVVRRDGSIPSSTYPPFNDHPLGHICGEIGKFHEALSEQIDLVIRHGVQGVYLDVVGLMAIFNCYNPLHSHAPGGGSYYADGYHEFLDTLRSKYPGICFATENSPEAFLGKFESMLYLNHGQERFNRCCPPFQEMVPAFNAIYHGISSQYGTYTTIDGRQPVDRKYWPKDFPLIWKEEQELDWQTVYPDQFFFEIARMIVWGLVPSIHNLTMEHCTSEKYAKEYTFLKEAARFYHENLEFLFDGDMLKLGEFECEQKEFLFATRMVLTSPENLQTIKAVYPCVLHSIWRAPSGDEALIAVNCTWEEQTFRYQKRKYQIQAHQFMKIKL